MIGGGAPAVNGHMQIAGFRRATPRRAAESSV